MKKPLLNNLQGSYVFNKTQRKEFNIPDGIFTNEARNWSDTKMVVQIYLGQVDEHGTAQDTLEMIIGALNQIKRNTEFSKGTGRLLFNYCSSLQKYYQDANVQKWFTRHYATEEILVRGKHNQQVATLQSANLALAMATVQSKSIEDGLQETSLKRKISQITTDQPDEEKTEDALEDVESSVGGGSEHSFNTVADTESGSDNEESLSNDDDNEYSFDSIDKHPKSSYVYNYFAQDCRQPWPTDSIMIGNQDLAHILERYRRQSYKAAKMLFSISDERILSLSFIFVIQPEDCCEGFLNDIKGSNEIIRHHFNTSQPTNTPDEAVLISNKIDNVRHNMKAVQEILAKEHANHWDDRFTATPYYNVINAYANYHKTLRDDHTEQDADTYEFFTREAFKDHIYIKHKMSKHLAVSKEFIPDFKISYQLKKEVPVDLFLIEIKKDDRQYTSAQTDFIKLHLEMQIMLNELIKLNVKDPVVYGLLVKGCKCTLYKMSLQTVYFSSAAEVFFLPRCLADVSLIPRVLSIFMTIKNEVDSMIKAINESKRGISPLLKSTRQGMGMPVKIRDPVTYAINTDANDYLPP